MRAWRRNKYNARRTVSAILKRSFDSAGECRYAEHLYAKQQNGEIAGLEFQVPWACQVNGVKIGKRVMWIDFRYFDKAIGLIVWDDFKGLETRDWAVKRDIWAAGGPGVLRVTRLTKDRIKPFKSDKDIWPANMLASYHKRGNNVSVTVEKSHEDHS